MNLFGLSSSLDAPIAVAEHADTEEPVAGVPHLEVEVVDEGRHATRAGVLQVDASLPLDFCKDRRRETLLSIIIINQ